MAIDDNASYELTGYQVKDLAQKIRAKADSASLGAVAFSNLYADLTGAPTIPTVYNGELTIQQNGTTVDTFTANSATNKTVNIETIYADTIAPAEEVGAITTSMIADEAVTTAKIDWSSVGDLSGNGFLRVIAKVYNRTLAVGDNDFSVDISSDIPSGFFPIGIVGRNMSGGGYTRVRVTREYISDDGTKIWVSNYFDYGSSSSITTTFYILCAKTS